MCACYCLYLYFSLDDEEQQWTSVKERIENEPLADGEDEEKADAAQKKSVIPCELPITKEVEALQRKALEQIGSTAHKVRDHVSVLLVPHDSFVGSLF